MQFRGITCTLKLKHETGHLLQVRGYLSQPSPFTKHWWPTNTKTVGFIALQLWKVLTWIKISLTWLYQSPLLSCYWKKLPWLLATFWVIVHCIRLSYWMAWGTICEKQNRRGLSIQMLFSLYHHWQCNMYMYIVHCMSYVKLSTCYHDGNTLGFSYVKHLLQ